MTTIFVPQDIYLKHESEWQAVRQATQNQTGLEAVEAGDQRVAHSRPASPQIGAAVKLSAN
ncbi:hypothetical protein QTL95_07775 [Rhizobium sp. S152]|uniref:hypothetical protein n=1 Tax=Rhizobium sp. S152 TaxID=3055038 RepID=UPI0025A96BCD|nr:hypothetical protein [Rhizobium sp. S152]MDM9625790.1 hypothetical protein [Rhizobium sp. S152]